ncbi:hypothetical protein [Streptomyces sp. NPDC096132]
MLTYTDRSLGALPLMPLTVIGEYTAEPASGMDTSAVESSSTAS